MITDETKPEDFHNGNTKSDFSHIKGWGIDADPENDPTYPMKNRTDEEQLGYAWERPEQQPVDIEILQSVERKNTTAVFGTAAPPSGISGSIRRYAYKFSESSYGRWLPLILADRIGALEGIAHDLKNGKLPNLIAEYGLGAEWKYNRKSLVLKVAGAALIGAAIGAYIYSRKNKKEKRFSK
ncbi:MAG TPA: hypothetical protein VFR70_08855 [Flavobacterium sp.]|nr:hypothetical protein [Flavobacterium sp.]